MTSYSQLSGTGLSVLPLIRYDKVVMSSDNGVSCMAIAKQIDDNDFYKMKGPLMSSSMFIKLFFMLVSSFPLSIEILLSFWCSLLFPFARIPDPTQSMTYIDMVHMRDTDMVNILQYCCKHWWHQNHYYFQTRVVSHIYLYS